MSRTDEVKLNSGLNLAGWLVRLIIRGMHLMECSQLRRIVRCVLSCCSWMIACVVSLAQVTIDAAERVDFNRDVRPILANNCYACHGPDANQRQAELRLDRREDALSAKSFVPGDSAASEIIKRVFSEQADHQMPPADANKRLSAREKEILKLWIEQGAEYQSHWAYQKPIKAEIPPGKNAIDYLIQQQLDVVRLKPSPPADRRTLLRRLHADLVGLPPSASEVAEFVNDSSSVAYAQLVENLLSSPHYGERMAIGWLDVVRFADTIGYHSDNPRNIWPYRDWVIRAFNQNKRFDRFTLEQIAGDLLPDADQETRVGSAFNRLLLSTEEGGAQAKDYEQRMLTDRVRAIGAVWLGQTTGCSQCHDHKFDPFTMRDFYSLGAFFADIKEPILGRREDGMMVLDGEGKKKREHLVNRLTELQLEIAKPRPDLAAVQSAWESASLDAYTTNNSWTVLQPVNATTEKKNVTLKIASDNVVQGTIDPKRNVRQQNDGTEVYEITFNDVEPGTTGFRIEALKEKSPGIGLASNGSFILTEVQLHHANKQMLSIGSASGTFMQAGFPATGAIDGIVSGKENGWGVLGASGTDQSLYLQLSEPLSSKVRSLKATLYFAAGENQEIANLRFSSTKQTGALRAPQVAVPSQEIAEILQIGVEDRSHAQLAKLHAAFKQSAPEFQELREKIANSEKEKADFDQAAPKCLVSVSDANKRMVRILPRGNWMDESGEVVKPALPHFLPQPTSKSGELTRLDLAQWLISRDNPLTARTVMNRLWKHFFGIGLSKVLDDLGAQGEPPSNGPLLDWLACEFMDSGWDMQHMIRLIVHSATYQQSSIGTDDQVAIDPQNRYVARQNPFRLEAELVRDNALAISGLLARSIGGPSVKPYQPEGYWENLNFPQRTYPNDMGSAQYRRGLYTWWQRSFLHPSMLAFDAPNREECCAERNRSNIPQQALVLLNDPTYVEAARVFASRILAESNSTTRERLKWTWQQALQREPTERELQTLTPMVEQRLEEYRTDSAAAQEVLKVGLAVVPAGIDPAELAAWTHVARIVFNLHEFLTRS